MPRWGKVDMSGLLKLQRRLEEIDKGKQKVIERLSKEIAARLLREVVNRTPVGQYSSESGMVGGTLRRGWAVGSITKKGDVYEIVVYNPVEYASYVEYGHRQTPGRFVPALGKRLKQGWVDGRFMLTLSTEEIEGQAPKIIERRIQKYLKGVLENGE